MSRWLKTRWRKLGLGIAIALYGVALATLFFQDVRDTLATITTRAGKGLPISASEYDVNVDTMRRQCHGTILQVPVAANRFLFPQFPSAATVTRLSCIVDPDDSSESVDVCFFDGGTSGDFTNCATNGIDTTVVTCSNTGTNSTSGFEDDAIAANAWTGAYIDSVTGTVSQLQVTICVSLD